MKLKALRPNTGFVQHFRRRAHGIFRGSTRSDKGQRFALNVCDRFSIQPRHPRITLLLGTLNLLAQFAVRYRLAMSDEPQRLGNEDHGPPTTKPYVSITLAQRYFRRNTTKKFKARPAFCAGR